MHQQMRKGFAGMAARFTLESRFTVLLIGQTGSGKTSVLNLLRSFDELASVDYDAMDSDMIKPIIDKQLASLLSENDQSCKMSSKTSDAGVYGVSFAGLLMRVIDTPGFADTRGKAEDDEHVKRIIQCLQQTKTINCVLLVMNGAESRMNETLKYTIKKVVEVMPQSIMKNFAMIFTNTAPGVTPNTDPQEVAPLLDGNLPPFIAIDNPFSILKGYCENPNGDPDEFQEMFKLQLKGAAKRLAQLFEQCKDFEEVPTKDFALLQEKQSTLQAKASNLLQRAKEERSLIVQIEAMEKEVKQCKGDIPPEFLTRTIITMRRSLGAHHHNVCLRDDCFSNCGHCNLQVTGRLWRWLNESNNCDGCGHSLQAHEVSRNTWSRHETTERFVNEDFGKCNTEVEKKEHMLHSLEQKRSELELSKAKIIDELDTTCADIVRIGIPNAVARFLLAQEDAIKEQLRQNPAEKGLSAMLEKVRVHLQAVQRRSPLCPACYDDRIGKKPLPCTHGVCDKCMAIVPYCPVCRAPAVPMARR